MTDRDDISPAATSSLDIEAADCWDPARPDGPVGPWDLTPPGPGSGLVGPTTAGPAEPWDPTRPDASARSSDLTRARGVGLPAGHGHRQRLTGIAGYAAVAAAAAIGGALVGGRRPVMRRG